MKLVNVCWRCNDLRNDKILNKTLFGCRKYECIVRIDTLELLLICKLRRIPSICYEFWIIFIRGLFDVRPGSYKRQRNSSHKINQLSKFYSITQINGPFQFVCLTIKWISRTQIYSNQSDNRVVWKSIQFKWLHINMKPNYLRSRNWIKFNLNCVYDSIVLIFCCRLKITNFCRVSAFVWLIWYNIESVVSIAYSKDKWKYLWNVYVTQSNHLNDVPAWC